jgi:hypothetical protein
MSKDPAATAAAPQRSVLVRVLLIFVCASAVVIGAAVVIGLLFVLAQGLTTGSIAGASALLATTAILVAILLFARFSWMGGKGVVAGLLGDPKSSAATRHHHLYLSAATYKVWVAAAVGLLIGAVCLSAAGPKGVWLCFFLLGAAVVTAAVVFHARTVSQECAFCGAKRARVKFFVAGDAAGICDTCVFTAMAQVRTAGQECAFCGAKRERVKFFVAGDAADICDTCVFGAMAHVASDFDKRNETVEWCRRLLGGLPGHCPRAISRPFIEMVAGPGPDRTAISIRNAVGWCVRTGNSPLALELLEALPEAERQPSDWINLGWAFGQEGRFAEAFHVTTRPLPEEDRPWVLTNLVWL